MSNLGKGLRWVGMPAFLAFTTLGAPQTALALPIVLLPTLGALSRWHTLIPSDSKVDLDTLTYIFTIAATLGANLDVILQALLSYALAYPLFGNDKNKYIQEFTRTTIAGLSQEQRAERASMALNWRYIAFVFLFNYALGPPLEELMKFAPIAWFGDNQLPRPLPRRVLGWRYVQYAIAAALGFATTENIAFVRAAVKSGVSPLALAVTVVERTLAGGFGHSLTAALLAVNAARFGGGPWSWGEELRILAPSVLYHATTNTILFLISALNGNVGWIHPTEPGTIAGMLAAVVGLNVTCGYHARRIWRSLV